MAAYGKGTKAGGKGVVTLGSGPDTISTCFKQVKKILPRKK